MKYFFIALVKLYQWTPLNSHNMCHFYPSCSTYMIESLERFGTIKGLFLGFKRILRCRPKGDGCQWEIDLVPEKKEGK